MIAGNGACDIYVLHCKANNGFGIAVVSVSPGTNPLLSLANWFKQMSYRNPTHTAEEYTVVEIHRGAGSEPGLITVCEYFDNMLTTGWSRPKKTDYDKMGWV